MPRTRFDLTTAHHRTGAERLTAFEAGVEAPSRSLLLGMAKLYRRPLLVFYLAEAPGARDQGEDLHALPGQERKDPELDTLDRDIKARQFFIRSLREDEHAVPGDFHRHE